MSSEEFWQSTNEELEALQEVWQIREQREDRRTARLMALMAEMHRDRKRHPQPYRENDFMPKTAEQRQQELDKKNAQHIKAFQSFLQAKASQTK